MLYKFRSKRLHYLFEAALHRLPADVQRNIVDRLQCVTDQPEAAKGYNCPTDAIGVSTSRCVYLNGEALATAPGDFVMAAIAHEFGHVFLGHTRPQRKGFFIDDATADRQVDAWVKLWGFRQLVKEFADVAAGNQHASLRTFGGELV